MPDDAEPNSETSELLTQNKRSTGVSYYVFIGYFVERYDPDGVTWYDHDQLMGEMWDISVLA